MGIKNLKHLLNTFCQDSIKIKYLTEYTGKILAIDSSIYLYKYIYNNSDHLEGFTRQTLRLLKNGIIPLYVFDGTPPKEKDGVLKSRKDKKILLYEKKELYEEKIKIIIDILNDEYKLNDEYCMKLFNKNYEDFKKEMNEGQIIEDISDDISEDTIYTNIIKLLNKNLFIYTEELEKINKKIISVNDKDIQNLKKMFDLFGVPYIIANGEAEGLCSKLCEMGIVHGCMSEDTDILANGGLLFIRNFNPDKNIIEEYSLTSILNKLEIDYLQFIDICILCGCDYTNKITGIGPITSLKLIKTHKNLETLVNILKINKKYNIPENFDYIKARKLFLHASDNNDFDEIKNNLKLKEPDIDKLVIFLNNNSLKIKDRYIKEINRNLIKYFNNLK